MWEWGAEERAISRLTSKPIVLDLEWGQHGLGLAFLACPQVILMQVMGGPHFRKYSSEAIHHNALGYQHN